MRNTDYTFVPTDSAEIVNKLSKAYEDITGYTIKPASPDKLFLSWVADLIIQERVRLNYVGNQNIPSRAEGKNLDELGKWIFNLDRKGKQAAKCSFEFKIAEAQNTAITIIKGTRVTDFKETLVWRTTEDALLPAGETSVEVMIQCETAGTIGNGYEEGQINTLIDVDNVLYFAECKNTTVSDGGAEEQTDAEYYEAMRASLASYSTAGSRESYIYWAKSVSEEIADVKVITPFEEREEVVSVWINPDNETSAFLGGDGFLIETLKVYDSTFSEEIDYDATYENGLLKITLSDYSHTFVGIKVTERKSGKVNIYAINNFGEPVTETVMEAIYDTCNADAVRPLTDYLTVETPNVVPYDISLTYYVDKNTDKSIKEIEANVNNAVQEYIEWQHAKMGRDINPDKLRLLLLQAGIKRCDISYPLFRPLSDGIDNNIPEVASIRNTVVLNGGYEDE